MFLDQIFAKIKFKRIVIFLVRIEGKSSITFQRYDIAFKEKKAVLESKSEKVGESAESLFEDVEAETPVYIYVLGRGIVNRLFTEEKIEDHSVEDLYPNFNSDLNYFIRSDISSSQTSVAFVRKTQIEEIILEKYFKEIQVLGFVFGLAPVITLLDYFDYEKSEVMLEGFWFKKLGEEYSAFKSDEDEEKIVFLEQEYDKEEILALSAAIYCRMKLLPIDLLNQKSLEVVTSSWVNKRVLPVLLGAFLLIVTGNYILFNRYSKDYNVKNEQILQGQKTLRILDELHAKIKENEKFIKDNNIFSSSDYSYFLDVISSNASRKVRFTRFRIHPLEKEIRNGKEAKFGNQLISIEGEAKNVTNYRSFLNQLIAIDRVKEVYDKSYRYDEKNKLGRFSIVVEYELNQKEDA